MPKYGAQFHLSISSCNSHWFDRCFTCERSSYGGRKAGLSLSSIAQTIDSSFTLHGHSNEC